MTCVFYVFIIIVQYTNAVYIANLYNRNYNFICPSTSSRPNRLYVKEGSTPARRGRKKREKPDSTISECANDTKETPSEEDDSSLQSSVPSGEILAGMDDLQPKDAELFSNLLAEELDDTLEPFGDVWMKYISKEPSYSLEEYNKTLPEGCKTLMDFFPYPHNYDFAGVAKLALDCSDGVNVEGITTELSENAKKDIEEHEKVGDLYTGPYPKSAYESITGLVMDEKKRIYTTLDQGDLQVKPEDMFEKVTNLKLPEKDDTNPLDNIIPEAFIYDLYGYLKHYLTNLNTYNYKINGYHQKDPTKLSYYLNHDYIQEMKRDFPPDPNHTKKVRDYFMEITPSIMDELVELIKNDPNRFNTPSPPLHDLSLLKGFRIPQYFDHGDDEDEDDEEEEEVNDNWDDENEDSDTNNAFSNYEKFANLRGLHEPRRGLYYPYSNTHPLRQRQLLNILIDVMNTGDLGDLPTYRKYISQTKLLRLKTFPTHTKYSKALDKLYIKQLFNDLEDDVDWENEEWIDNTALTEELLPIHADIPPFTSQKFPEVNSDTIGNPSSYSDPVSISEDDDLEGNAENEGSKDETSIPRYVDLLKLYEIGKKKRARALVYIEPGEGHLIINNRDGYQYMDYSEKCLTNILEPMSLLYIYKRFNVVAVVRGGGKTGQSVAIRHALVRYLYRILSPKLKKLLRGYNLVSIDSRKVERKKTSLRKARKREKYSKR